MIAILGASGYVGQAFVRALARRDAPFQALSRAQLDYADPARLLAYLREAQPEFLVNCAGYTGKPNVDACERNKADTLAGNAVLPGLIRRACAQAGVPWGHVSSGCIFSGRRPDGAGFAETDVPNFSFRRGPCSWYSGSKALGEETLGYGESADGATWRHEAEPDAYVWRLRIPFSRDDSPRNYLSKLLRYDKLLDAENSLSELDAFAEACLECWRRRVPLGIYNVTNPGAISTREVVELIRRSGVSGKQFQFFESDADFYRTAAEAPRSNCVLDSSKLARAGIRMAPVEEAIERALINWTTEPTARFAQGR